MTISASLRRATVALAALALGTTLAVAPTGPSGAAPSSSAVVLGVQTYNMDFGADLAPLFAIEDPADLVPATSAVWAEMQSSRIPERAMGVARLIAARQPDLVGLQEVSLWRSAPASSSGEQTGPFVTDYDQLTSLLGSLAALGTPYQVVISQPNFSNETFPLPAMTASGLRLVAFTDREVILVRAASLSRGRITLGAAAGQVYSVLLPVSVAGISIAVPRSFVTVDVTVRDRTIRFASTHLEAYGYPPYKDQIRNPQAAQLATALAASPYPVVAVGDVNARPTMCAEYRPGTPEYLEDHNVVAYTTLTATGLREVWPLLHPADPCGSPGWTSGQSTLDNAASTLTHRIDDVFVGPGFTALDAEVVGDLESDRTPSGLWPSDHASTWAQIRLDNGHSR
jgi:endonuclease/exonuclease/phosphatase family metal-dependent hydrolase